MNRFFLHKEQVLFATPGIGTVSQPITATQKGRIQYQASFWPAKLHGSQSRWHIAPGETVMVVGREGILLLVKPLKPALEPAGPFSAGEAGS